MSGDKTALHPKLTLFIQLEDGIAVDASLSPETKRYLQTLSSEHSVPPVSVLEDASDRCIEGWSRVSNVQRLVVVYFFCFQSPNLHPSLLSSPLCLL